MDDNGVTVEMAEAYREMFNTLAGSDLKQFVESLAESARQNMAWMPWA